MENRARYAGSMPALVTPFSGGKVDYDCLEELVEWQIASGTTGLVPCGTTGESPTLSIEEHHDVVRCVAKAAAGRVPVIAGAGSNDTLTACMHAREAEDAGADALLVIAPYYNKPNQEGMYWHFRSVAEASSLPVFLYNVPGRTVADIAPDTVKRLSELPNVIGIKDASGNVARVTEARLDCGEEFCILSGADELTLGIMVAGGCGAISVTANVAPALCAEFMGHCREGRWDEARALNDRLHRLHLAMFADPSPAPAKYAMKKLGRLADDAVRLPIVECSPRAKEIVDTALAETGLL
ncbi:4-hydroxy-tetrahydrodipicolinate synthase [Pacificimonas flava]|uniref:4-hydroxy-tetrahydrodipicolinate synthase n=2 Tax=Pacificimonas TaxID=1960290 RepID=A0A219B7P2_9SPHN|nr:MULTISPECIES: 4-hydroxy-tetrahydrodipicolinate synthase [Pacificimonas]MBZ6378541.1 4-hydroxy-tetrahydrodipicolinate synthase [Pacificimonas aurantium]OWV34173.1 4-hydroxy-tetrahydrodipicolinate synthase [Pacificimonas flava]